MKKISVRKVMSILSTFIIGLSAMGCVLTDGINVRAENNGAGISNPRISDDGTVTWDKITFGSYPQDMKASPIKWRILDIDDNGNAFLLADEALDYKPYNLGVENNEDEDTDYSCTWETCTLRDWLNGTDTYANDKTAFIYTAFTKEERDAIIETTVVNEDNPSYNTECGNNTTDKIYLLSIGEASTASYGFDTAFDTECKARQVKITDYAKNNGTYVIYSGSYPGKCSWWLRSSGNNTSSAAFVYIGGWGVYSGDNVNSDSTAVRPVLHVNLSSSYVKDAGRVTSEGSITTGTNSTKDSSRYNKPSISNGVTTWDCVYFGDYKQNGTFEKKPIEWRVLSVNDNDAFVVADKALDCKPYNNTHESCTWETCTLRDWLNRTDDYASDETAFINVAFTEEERNAIIETTVVNDGNLTNDKIYLLSIGEVSIASYGFETAFDTECKARQTKVTDYAKNNGVYVGSSSSCYAGNCEWWLRSQGFSADRAAEVGVDGSGYSSGPFVGDYDNAVRPAIHVNLSSSYVSVVGTVSSYGNVKNDIDAQIGADEVIDLISSIGTVTKESKDAIEAARKAYNELSKNAKLNVTNISVLEEAEAKLAELEKQAKEEADKAEKEKQEITAAAEVDRLITAIETVSTNSKIAIETARKAYNELSDGAKEKVTKLSVLETAEKTYADIEKNTNNSDNMQNTASQQASNEQQQPTSTEQPMTEENVDKPAKVKIASVRSNKSKSFIVIWKKIKEAKGYEVQYALNKKFTKNKKSKAVASASKVSLTVKKLKKGKTYYVRVRAYNIDSKGSKAYGKWSAVKKIKIKK